MNLKAQLSNISVEPGVEKQGSTLASYFEEDEQLCEALPDRLRGLIDLADFARIEARRPQRPGDSKTKSPAHAPASRVVEHLWRHVIETTRQPLGRYKDFVRIDERSGALDIRDTAPVLGTDANTLLAAQSKANGQSAVVSFLKIDRFDAFLEGGILMPRPVTAALMLASDVAFDQAKGTWNGPTTTLTGYEGWFANSEYQLPGASSLTYLAWPLPAGYSLPFYAALSLRWKRELKEALSKSTAGAEAPTVDADEMAQRFLRSALSLMWAKATRKRESLELAWEPLAERVVKLLHLGGTRTRDWALRQAGMLGAPEYGLSFGGANAWLASLQKQFGEHDWSNAVNALRYERRERAVVAGVTEPERVPATIDEAFKKHHWGRLIEQVHTFTVVPGEVTYAWESQREAPRVSSGHDSVAGLPNPVGDFKEMLASSGVDLPVEPPMTATLSQLPPEHLAGLVSVMRPFRGQEGVQPHALRALWRKAVEVYERPALLDVVSVENGRLCVAPAAISFGDVEEVSLAPETSTAVEHTSWQPRFFVPRQVAPHLGDPAAELPSGLSQTYKFIWDFAAWRAGVADTPVPLLSGWPGLLALLTYRERTFRVPFAVYPWLMYRAVESTMQAWSVVVPGVMSLPVESFARQDRVDALVGWLLQSSVDVRVFDASRHIEIKPVFSKSSSQWRELVGAALQPTVDQRRPLSIRKGWDEEIIFYAAPESMLSSEAAETIIDACPTHKHVAEVISRRRARLLSYGLTEEAIRAVDQASADTGHPWFKRFPLKS